MLRALVSRWLLSRSDLARPGTPRVESVPPLAFARRRWSSRLGDWLTASGWRVASVEPPSSFGPQARRDAVAAARIDFADALFDIHTDAAADMLDQIAAKQSLQELWHFRAEVFGRVAQRHGQREALRRLAVLDRHFPCRTRRAAAHSTSARFR